MSMPLHPASTISRFINENRKSLGLYLLGVTGLGLAAHAAWTGQIGFPAWTSRSRLADFLSQSPGGPFNSGLTDFPFPPPPLWHRLAFILFFAIFFKATLAPKNDKSRVFGLLAFLLGVLYFVGTADLWAFLILTAGIGGACSPRKHPKPILIAGTTLLMAGVSLSTLANGALHPGAFIGGAIPLVAVAVGTFALRKALIKPVLPLGLATCLVTLAYPGPAGDWSRFLGHESGEIHTACSPRRRTLKKLWREARPADFAEDRRMSDMNEPATRWDAVLRIQGIQPRSSIEAWLWEERAIYEKTAPERDVYDLKNFGAVRTNLQVFPVSPSLELSLRRFRTTGPSASTTPRGPWRAPTTAVVQAAWQNARDATPAMTDAAQGWLILSSPARNDGALTEASTYFSRSLTEKWDSGTLRGLAMAESMRKSISAPRLLALYFLHAPKSLHDPQWRSIIGVEGWRETLSRLGQLLDSEPGISSGVRETVRRHLTWQTCWQQAHGKMAVFLNLPELPEALDATTHEIRSRMKKLYSGNAEEIKILDTFSAAVVLMTNRYVNTGQCRDLYFSGLQGYFPQSMRLLHRPLLPDMRRLVPAGCGTLGAIPAYLEENPFIRLTCYGWQDDSPPQPDEGWARQKVAEARSLDRN